MSRIKERINFKSTLRDELLYALTEFNKGEAHSCIEVSDLRFDEKKFNCIISIAIYHMVIRRVMITVANSDTIELPGGIDLEEVVDSIITTCELEDGEFCVIAYMYLQSLRLLLEH